MIQLFNGSQRLKKSRCLGGIWQSNEHPCSGQTEYSNMTLQQQVQQHLQSTGISLRELARRSSVSHTTIGKILRDDALECGKQRRIAALEAEVSVVREQRNKLGFACEELTADLETEKRNFAALEQVHEQREQHLKSCENALIEAHVRDTDLDCAKYRRVMQLEQQLNDANTAYLSSKSQHERDLQRLSDANAEIKRLTALSETHGQSWKAACVQVEQLQKQLDHGQAQFKSLHDAYNQQVDDEREMLAQIDTLFVDRENAATLHDQQIMRLRMYVWSLIAALVLVLVSSLVVWGGV